MRGRRKWAALVLAAALLCGCGPLPYPREMGDMALLRTLGVDQAGRGLSVTASTGPQAGSLQGEQEPALVLSARRESLSAACLAMQSLSRRYVFFGYIDQLVLGEELARQDVRPILDACARNVELSLGAQVWLASGLTAEEAVRMGGSGGIDRQLTTLRTDGEMGLSLQPRTAGEVYADLLDRGCAYVPALARGEEDAALVSAGYGVLKDGALAGFLTGEAALGLERLAGGGQADIWTWRWEDRSAVLRAEGVEVRCTPEYSPSGELAGLRVLCRVKAEVVEQDGAFSAEEREQLREQTEARERRQILAALRALQGWGTDCTGLGLRAAAAHPSLWEKIKADWPEQFRTMPVALTVSVRLRDG